VNDLGRPQVTPAPLPLAQVDALGRPRQRRERREIAVEDDAAAQGCSG